MEGFLIVKAHISTKQEITTSTFPFEIQNAVFGLIATNPNFDILCNDPCFLKIVQEIELSPNRKVK
jgi:hypothetical protein